MAVLQCEPVAAQKLIDEWKKYLDERKKIYANFKTTADGLKKDWDNMGALQFSMGVDKVIADANAKQKKIDAFIALIVKHLAATKKEHDSYKAPTRGG